MMTQEVDVAVIGGGGAGLTAAIYSARGRRSTVVFERKLAGGQIATTDIVENYPGFPEGINGLELSVSFEEQARRFGARVVADEVHRLSVEEDGSFVVDTSGGTYHTQAVIVTAGAEYNKLGVPGEEEYVGHGVSYCATCDGAFFRDLEVAVVGGGNAAMDEGLFLTRFAKKVHVIHRRDQLRADAILQERAFANPKMDFVWNTVVESIIGGDRQVNAVETRDVVTRERSTLPVEGVFIFIGQTPNSHLLKGLVELDAGGHAMVDLNMRTAVPGLFAAGDVRSLAARQLVSAAGDGATAAVAAEHYLSERIGAPRSD